MDNNNLNDLALSLYEQGKYKQAFDNFMQLITTYDDEYAMQHIAVMYANGEGVKQDYDKSIEWDKKSIAKGNLTSMVNLAITYRMMGDIVQAKHWFEKSIQAGHIDSALPLAKLYMVSNKETETIKNLLQQVINEANSNPMYICEADVQEATKLLKNYSVHDNFNYPC